MTPPGILLERSTLSFPDGLSHGLSEQNLRLQQIVYEHKVIEYTCIDSDQSLFQLLFTMIELELNLLIDFVILVLRLKKMHYRESCMQ